MESLLVELQCPVCLELYNNPVILPCSHILCRYPCTERLLRHGFVRCPVCRDNTYVAEGTASLPRVLLVDNIICHCRGDVTHRADQSAICQPGDVSCQLCDSATPRRAHKTCVDCSASYCRRCLQTTHPQKEPFTRHHLVDPKLQEDPIELRCPLHDERVNVFCQTCRELGCVLCVGDLDHHPAHHILSLDQAVAYFKSELSDSLVVLSSSQESLKDTMQTQQQRLAEYQQAVEARRSQIREQCDSLTNEVAAKMQLLLSDLEYEETSKCDVLQTQMTAGRHANASLRNLTRHHNQLLEETDDPNTFIQAAMTALERTESLVGEAMEIGADTTDGATVTMNKKVVDFRKEKAILRDMSYLAVPQTPVIDVGRCSRSPNSVVLVLAPPDAYSDVIDGYKVCYSSETEADVQHVMTFRTPSEERKYGRSAPSVSAVCLIQNNLQCATVYHFSTRASNVAGESDMSETAICSTLSESLSSIPVPEISEQQCRVFSSSIQIQSESPLLSNPEACLSFFLLYREASTRPKIWKSVAMYDRADHRVFGLEPHTVYNFVVMACDSNGECQVSTMVSLSTEIAAY